MLVFLSAKCGAEYPLGHSVAQPATTTAPKRHARTKSEKSDAPELVDSTGMHWPNGSWAVITDGEPNVELSTTQPKPSQRMGGRQQAFGSLPVATTIASLIGLVGLAGVLNHFLTNARRKKQEAPQTAGD